MSNYRVDFPLFGIIINCRMSGIRYCQYQSRVSSILIQQDILLGLAIPNGFLTFTVFRDMLFQAIQFNLNMAEYLLFSRK